MSSDSSGTKGYLALHSAVAQVEILSARKPCEGVHGTYGCEVSIIENVELVETRKKLA
jgi:hypothetical protein